MFKNSEIKTVTDNENKINFKSGQGISKAQKLNKLEFIDDFN